MGSLSELPCASGVRTVRRRLVRTPQHAGAHVSAQLTRIRGEEDELSAVAAAGCDVLDCAGLRQVDPAAQRRSDADATVQHKRETHAVRSYVSPAARPSATAAALYRRACGFCFQRIGLSRPLTPVPPGPARVRRSVMFSVAFAP